MVSAVGGGGVSELLLAAAIDDTPWGHRMFERRPSDSARNRRIQPAPSIQ